MNVIRIEVAILMAGFCLYLLYRLLQHEVHQKPLHWWTTCAIGSILVMTACNYIGMAVEGIVAANAK